MKRIGMIAAIITFLSIGVITTNSWAEMRSGSFTITPDVGAYRFESGQGLKTGLMFGFSLGYNFNDSWTAECSFNYIDTEFNEGLNVTGSLYRLDAIYHLYPSNKLIPYLAAGLGGITLDHDRGPSSGKFLFNYGAGFKYFFRNDIALRCDIRHIISFNDKYDNLAYTLGFTIFF